MTALLALLLASAPAQAAAPYMWGAGPILSTTFMPGKYPAGWPNRIDKKYKADDNGRWEEGRYMDLNDDGEPDMDSAGNPITTELGRVGFDANIGASGYYYANRNIRIGATTGLGVGKGYTDIHLIPKIDKILLQGSVDFWAGGGIGFGQQWFASENGERLKVPYYPLRVETGAQIRQNEYAFIGDVFMQANMPGGHVYTATDGTEYDVGGLFFNYVTLGIEVGALFGDFKPPKKRRRGPRGKGKRRGKGKKGRRR